MDPKVVVLLLLIGAATGVAVWTHWFSPVALQCVDEPTVLTSQPVQRIVLTNRTQLNPLSVLEIKAYDSNGELIVGVPTSSSVRDNDMLRYGPQYIADALAGNLGKFAETRQDGLPEWIQLNLKHPYVLSKLEIYNRIDCCQSDLVGSELLLLDEKRNTVQTLRITTARKVYVFTQ